MARLSVARKNQSAEEIGGIHRTVLGPTLASSMRSPRFIAGHSYDSRMSVPLWWGKSHLLNGVSTRYESPNLSLAWWAVRFFGYQCLFFLTWSQVISHACMNQYGMYNRKESNPPNPPDPTSPLSMPEVLCSIP